LIAYHDIELNFHKDSNQHLNKFEFTVVLCRNQQIL